jgi:hypothetical protein
MFGFNPSIVEAATEFFGPAVVSVAFDG